MKKFVQWLSLAAIVVSPIYSPFKTLANVNQKWQSQFQLSQGVIAQVESNKFELKDFKFWSNQCLSLAEEKQYTQALAACEQAISLKPKDKNTELWFARSQALFYTNKYAESLTSFEHVVTNTPRHSLAIAYQCAILVQLDKYEDAIDKCEQALQINGNWGKVSPTFAWLYRGLAQRQLGELVNALDSYNRALKVNREDILVNAQRCALIAEIGDKSPEKDCGLPKAIEYYERAIALDASNPKVLIQQGLALEQAGFFDRALSSYDRGLKINPQNAFILARRCGVLNALEDYKNALESCDNALASERRWDDFTSAYVWTQRGAALIGLGKYEDALNSVQTALKIKSDYPSAFSVRAVSLWHLKKYPEAKTAIETSVDNYQKYESQNTSVRKYPDSPAIFYRGWLLAYYNQGRILSSLKRYGEAKKSYDSAIKIANKDTITKLYGYKKLSAFDQKIVANIITNQSANNIALSKKDGIIANLQTNKIAEEAVKFNRDSFASLYNKGLSYLHQGNAQEQFKAFEQANTSYQKALDDFKKAERLNPNNKYLLTAKGMALQGLQKYVDALEVYEQVLGMEPKNIQILMAKGTTLEKLKRVQEAIGVYEQIAEINPKDAVTEFDKILDKEKQNIYVMTAKGTALEKMEQFQEAILTYREILKIKPGYEPVQQRYTTLNVTLKNTQQRSNPASTKK
jgi:tetratricopeptide (TPR) repeat protein